MASGRLADYLGKGDAAGRPVTPDLHPEAIGFYFAEDTGDWSAWDGDQWLEDIMAGGGGGGGIPDAPIDGNLYGRKDGDWEVVPAGGGSDGVTIVTEASTSTMTPATHAGRSKYVRAGGNVTFNTSQGYAAGEVYNIRATAGLTLVGTGVTLTAPAGGTLALDAAMSVSVIMTSSSAGDVIGQTVPA